MKNFLIGIAVIAAIVVFANMSEALVGKAVKPAPRANVDNYYKAGIQSLDETQKVIAASQQGQSAQSSVVAAKWRIRSSQSAIDDSKSVYLSLISSHWIPGRYGNSGPAEIIIRCLENTTSITFGFNDQFMTDIQGYGNITYRIDKRKAQTRKFRVSTDNSVLGLWSGGSSIPFIKEMFGGLEMAVRATPFNESAIEARFPIEGVETEIDELRKACHW